MSKDAALRRWVDLLIAGDADAEALLTPALATAAFAAGATRETAADHFLPAIGHYIYAGDTALHIAAAAHRPDMLERLIARGASVSAANRHGATALHYAADGRPDSPDWSPEAQAGTIARLIAAGADPDAIDRMGVTPLHRAVRTRSAAAAAALIEGGADPRRANAKGSTPMRLAQVQSGRSGSGSAAAKAEQARIILLLEQAGA